MALRGEKTPVGDHKTFLFDLFVGLCCFFSIYVIFIVLHLKGSCGLKASFFQDMLKFGCDHR